MKSLKVTGMLLTLATLVSLNALASSGLTKCGDYYVDRSSQEVYQMSPGGKKITLGVFDRDPVVQDIEVYPGYQEESILLKSGIVLSIRTSRNGESSAILADAMNYREIGSCQPASSIF
jgi:hypothetical protein